MGTQNEGPPQSEVTVTESLDSLPEEKREDMANFLYSRIPCRYGLRNITALDSQQPVPISSVLCTSAWLRRRQRYELFSQK